jgi:hypothetical protein
MNIRLLNYVKFVKLLKINEEMTMAYKYVQLVTKNFQHRHLEKEKVAKRAT